jgi:2,4-dienoyl-CoA reductase (NADPH2)
VRWLAGVEYRCIDDAGLHITVNGEDRLIEADHVVICAGQEPARALLAEIEFRRIPCHVIGGARLASELDAQRAIDEGTRLAYAIGL